MKIFLAMAYDSNTIIVYFVSHAIGVRYGLTFPDDRHATFRYDAEIACQSYGGHLAHVTSAYGQQLAASLFEKEAVTSLLDSGGGLWIAYHRNQWRWIHGSNTYS